jgi:hypothetical protein
MTPNALKAWFRDTEEGRMIIQPLLKGSVEAHCRVCQTMPVKPRVLAVLRRLGRFPGVEIYSERGANVKIVELPDFPDDLAMEELLESYLPRPWKHMAYVPMRDVQSGVFRGISIENALEFEEALRWVSGLRRIKKG